MIIKYLDGSFVNALAKDGLIKLIRSALPSIELRGVGLGDIAGSEGIILAEENIAHYVGKLGRCRNIFLLVSECFLQNTYTGRLTRNLSSANIIGLLAHVLAFHLHLIMHFRKIGKLSKWDILLLPLVPPFLALYLCARLRRASTMIRSLVEHEFHLAGLQYTFDKMLPNVAGLIFTHPVIRTAYNKYYPKQKKFSISPNPVFDDGFEFKVTGNQLLSINWYGYRNQWRIERAREVADQIRASVPAENGEISLEYKFTSTDSPEVFHLVMRQSETWPLSSSTKIRDILAAGKIPVLEYAFCDHPVCELALPIADLVELYRSGVGQRAAIDELEKIFRKKINLYNAWAIAENARDQSKLIEFMESQCSPV